jgi:hypothetical protein
MAQQRSSTTTAGKGLSLISGEPFVDRKSTFQAHACRISSTKMCEALHQLLDGTSVKRTTQHGEVLWSAAVKNPSLRDVLNSEAEQNTR